MAGRPRHDVGLRRQQISVFGVHGRHRRCVSPVERFGEGIDQLLDRGFILGHRHLLGFLGA
jgi:hypothetical protein